MSEIDEMWKALQVSRLVCYSVLSTTGTSQDRHNFVSPNSETFLVQHVGKKTFLAACLQSPLESKDGSMLSYLSQDSLVLLARVGDATRADA